MRFNDLLRTVLAHGGEGKAAAVTRWRQCIDLVAQYDVSGAYTAYSLTEEDTEAVFEALGALSKQLGPEQRVASIVELGGRLRSVRLCRFLAQDHPAVVASVMARARLADEDWASIIPALGPLARSILRRRADLGAAAHAALARFGTSDLALPSAPHPPKLSAANDVTGDGSFAESASQSDETSDIRKIVERIERFTATRGSAEVRGSRPAPLDLVLDQVVEGPRGAVDAFSFETDEKGRFSYVHGAPRAAVVGLTIGAPALDGRSGADGQALGAYRRRAAFRDARFAIPSGTLVGEWRITGEPRFDRASGLFRGYSASARREMAHEQLVRSSNGATAVVESDVESVSGEGSFDWTGLSAAGARQLIHELRTPLSAIYAYAEMIEGQLVGPVSSEYREIAAQIIADARELVTTFDDLDLAGRITRNEDHGHNDVVDLVGQLRAIIQRFASAGSNRIALETMASLPPVLGDRDQIERMLMHLVRAGYAALGDDEPLAVRLRYLPVTGTLSIAVERPAALRELSEQTLLDHASPIDQMLPDAPPLGLAFALRLVRGIAGRMGGQLLLSPDAFELVLPAATQDQSDRERGS